MSSSFVADTSEQKQDGSVVIVLNEDGTVSLDEQTLQKLLAAKTLQQQVSVVRMNQSGEGGEMMSTPITLDDVVVSDEGQPEVNLTVEGFYPSAVATDTTPSSADPMNPFMQMDPEQLEKLENALQSEQAKQILGEGVSAMLDMLTAKEEKTEESSKKATSIQLDHCYTGSSKSGAAEVSAEETESDEEELERKRRSQRGKGRATRGGKTVPVSPAKTRTTPPAATRKSARAQAAAPAPPPESTPPAELTKLGQSPAKTLLRTSKVSPVKKEPVVVPERKTYPQRTNRKPPAHLADAYGPGIFSSPDTPKKTVEVAKKEPVLDLVPKVEEIPSLNLDIIPINSAQALLEPEAIEELQAVLSDLGPEILKPLEEAKAEMDEALMEEAEEQKVKAEAIAARRRSSSSKASVTADDEAGSPSKSGRPPRKAGLSRVTSEAIKDIQAPSDEEDSGDEEGDEEWDSEDDPDKLWCICRKPHNNRFMICCDKCEDWFHGKCVGITKAMGKQMELEGKEWTCPKCKKLLKQNEIPTKIGEDNEKKIEVSSPAKARRSSSTSSAASTATVKKSPKPAQPADKPEKSQVGSKLISKRPEAKKLTPLVIEPTSLPQAATPVKKVSCLVCKKPARTSSIYCSDDCILIHAQDSLTLLKKEKVLTPLTAKAEDPSKSAPSENSQADTSENRVLMFEQKTGRILAGTNAPTESNLKTWLKEHPTYQVCKPNLVANIRQKLQKLTGDKQQIYIKPQHPKVELNDVPILGLPMKTPKTPQTPISRTIVIPSQRLPLTGKSPSPTIKTVMKADAKGTASTLPAAGTKQPTVKTVTKIQSAGVKSIAPKIANKEQSSSSAKVSTESSPAKKQASVEATRLSVRNSLQDVFKARMVECKDLKVSENELKGIATSIEEELYAYFKDTGAKYKAKFRSIHFNVKDPKNLTLFKKIITGEYIPHQLVRLSSEDLASKELAEWREQEEKHQIEMIKKTEMDLLQQNVTYIKTHKGEQMIETEDSLKLQTDAVEAETAVEPIPDSSTAEEVPNMRPPSSSSSHGRSKSSSSKDKERSTSSHKHHHKSSKSSRHHDSKKHSSSHKSSSHSKEKSHSKDSKDSSKEKDAKTKSDSHSKSSSNSRRHSRHGSSDHKTRDSEEKSSRSSSSLSKTSDSKSISKDKVTPVVEELSESAKEIMEKLEKIKSGTLTPAVIPPEEETLSDREPSSTVNIKTPESVVDEGHPPIWKGLVTSQDVSNFKISIYEVSGSAQNFGSDFPKECDIVGRIAADTVEDYITKVKKVGTKDIMVVKLMATSPEDKQSYITYYNYLLNRNRFGVVGKKGSKIKDFYIFPLPSKSPVPQFLLPFDGPGLDENRPNLLLGVVVQMYRKRAADSGASAGPSKISKSSSKFDDRSYTPPLPDSEKSAVSSNSVEPYSPTQAKIKKVKVTPTEEDEPYSPTGGLNSPDDIEMPLASELEELNRKIEEEKLRIETISSELVCTKSTGPFGEPVQVATFLSNITSDLVSSQPSAIPGLSETIVESSGVTLKGSLAMDKGDDDSEAYSPSRSFTPPPQAQSIPFFNDTSTISLPSNLQEILASITKKPSVPEALSMGLALDCDPIVREYADETLEEPVTPPLDSTTKALMEIEQFESDMKNYALSQSCAEQPRDPRQKQTQKMEKQSALSKMSEADLIAKANEMLMEQEIAAMPAKPPQAIPFVPPPQTGFPQMHVPPPMPPMVPSVFDIPPPPPGIDFKDQDMRQLQQPPSSSSNERKGISFKVTKKPNLPRWDRKRQDDWDTDSSGTSYSKRGRLSPLPK